MTREPLVWPDAVRDDVELEELLSRPSVADVEFLAGLPGDVVVLGAGGKMGPSLARRVKRAADASGVPRRVTAVSRFSSAAVAESLEEDGVAVAACDLLDPAAVERLPDAPNVLFLAGMKFGATANPGLTWALNTVVPGHVARRYRGSRTVVFSTGNVYPLVDPGSGGCTEADATGPVGEYAQSCLGRERDLRALLARARHAVPPLPALLRRRPALRHARRRGAPRPLRPAGRPRRALLQRHLAGRRPLVRDPLARARASRRRVR